MTSGRRQAWCRSVVLLGLSTLCGSGLTHTSVGAGNEAVLAGAMPRVFASCRWGSQGAPVKSREAIERPDFNGVWQLHGTENLSGFMQSIGYNFFLAKAASLARVTQTIEQKEDELRFTFEVNPPLLSPR
ncbi:unnamed protein product, partial [Effrenium voratum]